MNLRRTHIDKPLALLLATLVVGGSLIFASAAFGLIARGTPGMTSAVFSHLVLGIGVGLGLLAVTVSVDYHCWRTFSPYLYGLSILITALVFVPHLGASYLGGQRWISVAHVSFQPSESLKIGCVLIAAAYFSAIRERVQTLRWGVGGFLAIILLPSLLLVKQPDIGTLGVVVIGVFTVFVAAGARFRDVLLVVCAGLLAVALLAVWKPYIRDRVITFFDPSQNQLTQGYQINQSLIAIGSGGIFGRGFGQGVQKFTYLPEPMGDSIFAVAGEELGFVGTVVIVCLFLGFALRGISMASRAPDLFGSLLAIGISVYLGSEAFINIAAMLGLAPLTGIPLTFVSQGGTAMLVSLGSAGILLNISKYARRAA